MGWEHTQGWADYFAMTRILICPTLEADERNWKTIHCVGWLWGDSTVKAAKAVGKDRIDSRMVILGTLQ